MTGNKTTDYHPIVRRYAKDGEARGQSPGTIDGYRVASQAFIQFLVDDGQSVTDITEDDLAGVNEDDVTACLTQWAVDYPDSSLKTRFYNLRSFFHFLDREGVIDEDPSDGIELKNWIDKRGKTRTQEEMAAKEGVIYLEKDEFEKLLEHVPDPRGRNVLLLRLMFQTGIRPSEACKIRLDDINPEKGDKRHILIRTSKRDAHVRDVWWQPSLDLQMRRWLEADREAMPTSDSPYLFVTRYSEQMDFARPNRIVGTAAENAEMQSVMFEDAGGMERTKITAKCLRHSFSVHYIRSGGDLMSLSGLLGHTSTSTTEFYLRFKTQTKKDKMMRHAPD